jgi:hypothetical protein
VGSLGTRSVGLTAQAPEEVAWVLRLSCGFAGVPIRAFLASGACVVSPTELKGGRTNNARLYAP